MHLRLRPGEKLYINGAVIKVDRRVSVEVLNDVTFLLQAHVLQAEDATTPLRQLYFAVQSALMEPKNIDLSAVVIADMLAQSLTVFANKEIISGLLDVRSLVERHRYFESLRIIRSLFVIESKILDSAESAGDEAA